MDSHASTETCFLTYIDLGLANTDTSTLETHLAEERSLRPDGIAVSLDYPVQTLPGGIVEISWGDGITPSAHNAIKLFAQHFKTVEPEHRKVDLTHHRNANIDEEHAKIVALVKAGNELAAVKLTRQVYGYNLTQAHEFVQKLLPPDL